MHFVIYLFLLLSIACAQKVEGLGGAQLTTTPPGGEPPNSRPVATIPPPAMLVSDKILAFVPDEQNVDTVVGAAGAVEYALGNQIVLTTNAVLLSSLTNQSTIRHATIRIPFVSTAYAQETLSDADLGNMPSGVNLCTVVGVTCCPINPDGSFECPHQLTDETVTEISMATMNADGNLGAPILESIQSNAYFLAAAADDIASGSEGSWYALTQQKNGVAVSSVNNHFAVLGDRTANYQSVLSDDAHSIVFNPTGSRLAFRRPQTGIAVFPVDQANGSIISRPVNITAPNTKEYTVLKQTFGQTLMFGTEKIIFDTSGYIFDLLSGLPQSLYFLRQNDIVSNPLLAVKKTITFDVDSAGYILAIFEDGNGNIRIRAALSGSTLTRDRFGGETPIGSYNFKDLKIYRENFDANIDGSGKALILEPHNNKIYQLSYNYQANPKSITLGAAVDLGAGKNPQSITFNQAYDRAYIVNAGDDTITVLPLKDRFGGVLDPQQMQTAMTHFPIKQFIDNKNFALTPNSIALQVNSGEEQLLVSTTGIQGAVVIPTASIQGVLPFINFTPRPLPSPIGISGALHHP